MDENVAALYHFSVSLDDSFDENIDIGKIRGRFMGRLRKLKPQDPSLPLDFEDPPEVEGVIIVLHLSL